MRTNENGSPLRRGSASTPLLRLTKCTLPRSSSRRAFVVASESALSRTSLDAAPPASPASWDEAVARATGLLDTQPTAGLARGSGHRRWPSAGGLKAATRPPAEQRSASRRMFLSIMVSLCKGPELATCPRPLRHFFQLPAVGANSSLKLKFAAPTAGSWLTSSSPTDLVAKGAKATT